MHFDAPFLELLRHEFGGAEFFQAEFRMGVDVAANGGKFVLVETGAFECVHAERVLGSKSEL